MNSELLEISQELKKCREAKGMSIDALADKTKISVNFVNNFEDGQFQFLPEVYIRAFLKTIALEVGLDADVILRQFSTAIHKSAEPKSETPIKPSVDNLETKQPLRAKKKELLAKFESFEKPWEKIKKEPSVIINDLKNISLDGKTTGPMIIGAVGFILLLFIIFALPKDHKQEPRTEKFKIQETTQNIVPAAPDTQPMQSEVLSLTVKAVQNTWLRIVFDDSVADEATFSPGDLRSWNSHNKFYLRVGNVGGVELILNGKNLGSPGEGPQIANLMIDQQGITPVTIADLPAAMNP